MFDELQKREHERVLELILQGFTNKQVHEITNASYSKIKYIRVSIPIDIAVVQKKRGYAMRVGFWDEWELAVYRIFGGRKRVHLNP